MTAGSEFLLRGPGIVALIAAGFALGYFLFRNRRWLGRAVRWGSHAAPDDAHMHSDRKRIRASRSEIATQFCRWNRIVEAAVAVLKQIPLADGDGDAARLGIDAAGLRDALLGEQRRLRVLDLQFADPAERERYERVLTAAEPLAEQLWHASQDPLAYRQAVRGAEPEADEVAAWPGRDRLQITYRGAGGAASGRVIAPMRLARRGHVLYLGAHCQMRNAYRHFRADRIDELIDLSTGEIVAGRAITAWLIEHVSAATSAPGAFSGPIESERGSHSLPGRVFAAQTGSRFAGRCSSVIAAHGPYRRVPSRSLTDSAA